MSFFKSLNEKKAKKYIQTLIERMCDDTQAPPRSLGNTDLNVIIGSDSTRWKALREAEKLKDYKYYIIVKDLLSEEKNKERRGSCYFILKSLWKNLDDNEIIIYFIESLKQENSHKLIQTELSSIALSFKPISRVVASSLYFFLDHSDRQVNIEASRALYGAQFSDIEIEKKLLQKLLQAKNDYDILYIVRTLGVVGSKASIAPITTLLPKIKNDDTLGVSLSALGQLCQDNCNNIYIYYFKKSRSLYARGIALSCLYKYCKDISIADDIYKRARTILSREKRTYMVYQKEYPQEIVYCLMYLKKVNSPLFDKTIEYLKVHVSSLCDAEKKHIKQILNIDI